LIGGEADINSAVKKEPSSPLFHLMYNTRQIVIIDDDVMFRKGLMKFINLFPGYAVLFDSSNGKEFIAQLNPKHLPDIVLMDITMPEMDGFATAEWLHKNYPDIYILALSTMNEEAEIIKMLRNGARGYLLKDAEPDELKQAFGQVLSQGYLFNNLITRKILRGVYNLFNDGNPASIFAKLTDREIEFLKYCCTEMSYKEMAEKMFLSVRSIEGYRDNLCMKLDLKNRVGLAMYAIKNQIVTIV
jgi:DNA-binding NarL/FixJ family response regulator